MLDGFHRNIDYIRLSVTDRCNLRCIYCMPPDGIRCLPMSAILSFEEIIRVCSILAQHGIRKIKITGGEPFVRKDICQLITRLKQISGIEKVTITTNGTLITPYLEELAHIGIDGINYSLDSMDLDTFHHLAGDQGHYDSQTVIDAILESLRLGIQNIKINCVPISGINDAEIIRIADIARQYPVHVRFIEMMPIGLGKDYHGIAEETIQRMLTDTYGPMAAVHEIVGNGPAHYYHIDGFKGHIGFISAMSHMFCESCNRIRLTSDGQLKTCLFYNNGADLRSLLRNGSSDEVISEQIAEALKHKPKDHDLKNQPPEDRGMSQIGG